MSFRSLAIGLAALLVAAGCRQDPSEVRIWPAARCFEMNLDAVAWGSSVQDTYALAGVQGWECSLESAAARQRFALRCRDGDGQKGSVYEFGFVRDTLISVLLERSPGGPDRACADPPFEVWSESEVEALKSRFGPSDHTTPVEPRGRIEAHRWTTPSDEIVLRILPHAQRLAIEGVDRAALASLEMSREERLTLIAPTEDGVGEAAIAEEVSLNLQRLRLAQQEHFSEFGFYRAAGPYPPAPPRGAYHDWIGGDLAGFAELGFTPVSGSAACSYAVSVSPGCGQGEPCAFTAAASCDRLGTGEAEYWALIHSPDGWAGPTGPFGVCSGHGVHSPETGRHLRLGRVGRCWPSAPPRQEAD